MNANVTKKILAFGALTGMRSMAGLATLGEGPSAGQFPSQFVLRRFYGSL